MILITKTSECVCVCVFILLHITAQSGPAILIVILRFSHPPGGRSMIVLKGDTLRLLPFRKPSTSRAPLSTTCWPTYAVFLGCAGTRLLNFYRHSFCGGLFCCNPTPSDPTSRLCCALAGSCLFYRIHSPPLPVFAPPFSPLGYDPPHDERARSGVKSRGWCCWLSVGVSHPLSHVLFSAFYHDVENSRALFPPSPPLPPPSGSRPLSPFPSPPLSPLPFPSFRSCPRSWSRFRPPLYWLPSSPSSRSAHFRPSDLTFYHTLVQRACTAGTGPYERGCWVPASVTLPLSTLGRDDVTCGMKGSCCQTKKEIAAEDVLLLCVGSIYYNSTLHITVQSDRPCPARQSKLLAPPPPPPPPHPPPLLTVGYQ